MQDIIAQAIMLSRDRGSFLQHDCLDYSECTGNDYRH